ncbi:hypothetical protein BDV98DRAFT_658678 [Pterulicium gracile]|uniref:Lysine-specific metallo-endopeptidase domain-containing protein n=1 Tax=Pterulicium gracile TaxID=1884261 RepID=A0A5C3QAJ7_9AGAR|nr:hypothetical protein BDV98DRAFT_658678 [Pterula gracilis]
MFRAAILLGFVSLALGLSIGDLEVSVKAVSSKVASVDDLVLTAIVSNPTDAEIRVIKNANVLDSRLTSSFAVKKDGEDVLFTGLIVTPNFDIADNFVTIAAGKSIAVNHTVSNLYDFASHGAGTYTFSPRAVFQTEANSPDVVSVSVEPITVEITSDVAHRELFPGADELRGSSSGLRASGFDCPDGGRLATIQAAHDDARSLASAAASRIRNGENDNEFTKFFSSNDRNEVARRYDLIANDAGDRTIHCNQDPAGICGGAAAYVMLSASGTNVFSSEMYMCDSWFNFQPTGNICSQPVESINSSLGGVMLHEMSHATSATNDQAYGCSTVNNLSASQQLGCADNYQNRGKEDLREILDESESFVQRVVEAQSCRHLSFESRSEDGRPLELNLGEWAWPEDPLDLRPLYTAHCAGNFMFTFDEVDGLEDLVWIDETTGQPLEAEEMVPRLEGAQSQYCQRLLGRVSELEKEVQRSRDAAGSSLDHFPISVFRLLRPMSSRCFSLSRRLAVQIAFLRGHKLIQKELYHEEMQFELITQCILAAYESNDSESIKVETLLRQSCQLFSLNRLITWPSAPP